MSGDGPSDDLFSPVSVDRVAYVIVDQIKLLIREGKLKAGDRLPSERSLCQRFGVSRVTVREALRVLEANGLVQIKVGARGGAFLTSPSAEQLGEGLASLLSLSPVTASDVTEARMVVELATLPLAVERATPEDLDDLFAIVQESQQALEAGKYTMGMSAAFHIRLAQCSHNPAIEALVQSFHGPMLMSLNEAQVAAPLMGHQGTEEHRQLAEAVKARDLDRAREVMRVHLERTASRLRGLEESGGDAADA